MPAATTDRSSSAAHPSGRPHAPAPGMSNLVAGDTNDRFDIFVFDRQTQTTERVSLSSAGLEGNNDSLGPSISADGQVVAFESAGALVAEDGGFPVDVFVHDEQP